jgi:CheY-like chemotaxis protein
MEASARPSSKRVLIVEDNHVARSALSIIVRHLGWEVTAAATLAEAMLLLGERPHCVLLDLILPDGSGADVLRHIREKALPARVAVTTGTSDEQMMREVQGLRPDALYHKPLDLSAVERWLTCPQ